MTRRGDDKAWSDFVVWCKARGLSAIPANPWTLAAYARWCERRHRYPAIAKAIRAIARIHNTKSRARPERDPVVTRTLRRIETKGKTKAKARKKKPDLFPEDDLTETAETKAAQGKGKAKNKKKGKADPKKKPAAKKPAGRKTKRRGLSAAPKLVARRRLKS